MYSTQGSDWTDRFGVQYNSLAFRSGTNGHSVTNKLEGEQANTFRLLAQVTKRVAMYMPEIEYRRI